MSSRESRIRRLHVHGDKIYVPEAKLDRLDFLTYEELKRMILDESHEGKVKVRMYLGSGSSLQDVLLDTTTTGFFFQDTESHINLATEYFLDNITTDDEGQQITGQFFSCVIPSASLWIPPDPTDRDGSYSATFENEDNPKYWRFKQNPNNPSFFCIYTKQKKSEAIAAESELPTAVQGTTEEGAAGSQEPSCSMVTIALMTKVVDDEPPRSNTIVGKESSKHNYIFDVRFTAVRMVPIATPKEPLSKNEECNPSTTSESSEQVDHT